jgi:peptidoglycan hydrolase-like protein with peptidoglycan-binding domain
MGAGTGAVVGAVAGAGVGAIPGALIGGAVGAGAGAATKPEQVNLGEPVWHKNGGPESQSTETSSVLSHDKVTQLQLALSREGFGTGHVDGVFGPQTRAALQKFQASRNLPATGEPDQQTLSALRV